MSLHQHKSRLRLGPPEIVLILLLALLAIFMLSGSLAISGSDWQQAEGKVLSMRRVQHASNALGTPHRINVTYEYSVGADLHTDTWEGEWPTSHSPNALPPEAWDRLQQPGYPLMVLYDPEAPERNSLHATQNHFPAWWFRLSLGACILVLWCVFAIYPRWKTRF